MSEYRHFLGCFIHSFLEGGWERVEGVAPEAVKGKEEEGIVGCVVLLMMGKD